jgi:hypothetical protein
MKVSRQVFLKKSFVFRPVDAEKLYRSFKELVGEPRFTIECSDGLDRELGDLDSLLDFENALSKQIESVKVMAGSESWEQRATLKLTRRGQSTVFISLDGSEDVVSKLNEAIEDRIEGMSPWYAPLTRIGFVNLAIALLVSAYFIMLIVSALGLLGGQANSPSEPDLRTEAYAYLLIFGATALVFAVGRGLDRVRDRLFPKGTFAIGQGEERHKRQEMWRWTVVIGFLVSLVAGVVLELLWSGLAG